MFRHAKAAGLQRKAKAKPTRADDFATFEVLTRGGFSRALAKPMRISVRPVEFVCYRPLRGLGPSRSLTVCGAERRTAEAVVPTLLFDSRMSAPLTSYCTVTATLAECETLPLVAVTVTT
jgi:hypothetical protein